MKIKKLFSVSRFMLFFVKFLFQIKPIEDKTILNLMAEKTKKFGLTPSKIGFLRGKGEIKGLSQIVVKGDARVKDEIVIAISENLFHEISDLELEAHLAIAIAESQYTYQARYCFAGFLIGIFCFFLIAVHALARPFILPKYFEVLNLIFFISLFASIFIVERLKQIGIYVTTMRRYNTKLETLILLKDNFLKEYTKFPILVPILTWLKFMSPNQIQKLKKFVEDAVEFDFFYMLKVYAMNPIILSTFAPLVAIIISLYKY